MKKSLIYLLLLSVGYFSYVIIHDLFFWKPPSSFSDAYQQAKNMLTWECEKAHCNPKEYYLTYCAPCSDEEGGGAWIFEFEPDNKSSMGIGIWVDVDGGGGSRPYLITKKPREHNLIQYVDCQGVLQTVKEKEPKTFTPPLCN